MREGLQTRAAVARFLGVEPEEVERMTRQDAMPHTKVPTAERVVLKFFLPDLHAWLLSRSKGNPSPKLASYETFKREFLAAQPERKSAKKPMEAAAAA